MWISSSVTAHGCAAVSDKSVAQSVLADSSGAASSLSCPVRAQTPVLTQHNNNARTGTYTTETILTPANVNQSTRQTIFLLCRWAHLCAASVCSRCSRGCDFGQELAQRRIHRYRTRQRVCLRRGFEWRLGQLVENVAPVTVSRRQSATSLLPSFRIPLTRAYRRHRRCHSNSRCRHLDLFGRSGQSAGHLLDAEPHRR
jgi:hypothetical protein